MRPILISLLASTFAISGAHAGFYGMGADNEVSEMTPDGMTLVGGHGPGGTFDTGFTWTAAQGLLVDTTTVSGSAITHIEAVAGIGTTYAGSLANGSAFVRQGSTYSVVNTSGAGVYISRDGSTVIGNNYGQHTAWGWRTATGAQTYALPAGKTGFELNGVSSDGAVAIGTTDFQTGVYRWDAVGMPTVMATPTGFTNCTQLILSANGTVAFLTSDATSRIVRYNGLGSTPTEISTGYAASAIYCTSLDGSFAGGSTNHPGAGEAMIWDSLNGIRKASTLISASGVDLTGWLLESVDAISDDGKTYAGYGSLNGVAQSWVFTAIPEPSSYGLMAAGAIGLVAVVRRRTKRK